MARKHYTYEELLDIRDRVLPAGPAKSHARGMAAMDWAFRHGTTQTSVAAAARAIEAKQRIATNRVSDAQWAFLIGEGPDPDRHEQPSMNGHMDMPTGDAAWQEAVLDRLNAMCVLLRALHRAWVVGKPLPADEEAELQEVLGGGR